MRLARLAATGLLALAISCGGSSPTANDGGNPPPPPPPPGGANVGIEDFSFSPETVTVKVGAAVQWVNNGASAHQIVSDDGVWDTGNLAPPSGDPGDYGNTAGQKYQFTFTTAGSYNYHCSNHPLSAYPNFKGVVIVTP